MTPPPNIEATLSLDEARAHIAQLAFQPAGPVADGAGAVGLEPELFPIRHDAEGRPLGRLALNGPGGVIDVLDRHVARRAAAPAAGAKDGDCTEDSGAGLLDLRRVSDMPPGYEFPCGGRLTFEPGAQIEHSTHVHSTAAAALDDVERVRAELRSLYAGESVVLAAGGIDVWNSVEDVPQQLAAPRYEAMAAYLAKIGPSGRTMMRMTSSLQVNLDLGPPGVYQERWLLSNLFSPLLTAIFSTSPCNVNRRVACARAQAWQGLDPSRTGFPRPLLDGSSDDPGEQYADLALNAAVLLLKDAEGHVTPGDPKWSFADWMREGHPTAGFPTRDDLTYHLTTLFPEVRPRGFLEMRAADGVPIRLCPALVVFTTGLIYDARARSAALELLAPARPRLDELWRHAAEAGLRDDELQSWAARAWELALEGAARLPEAFYRPTDLSEAASFAEQYTAQRRSPADELRELLQRGPEHALAWASGLEVPAAG